MMEQGKFAETKRALKKVLSRQFSETNWVIRSSEYGILQSPSHLRFYRLSINFKNVTEKD